MNLDKRIIIIYDDLYTYKYATLVINFYKHC